MTQFEYKDGIIAINGTSTEALNKLGAEGWELKAAVSMQIQQGGLIAGSKQVNVPALMCVFMRPKVAAVPCHCPSDNPVPFGV